MGENKFSRELRLLTPSHYSYVFENAIPAVSPTFTILARKNLNNKPRLGITIAKKKVKLAHDRNRIKRLIRESFRHKATHLPDIDIIVIGKTGADKLTNQQIFTMLDKLWKKIIKRCEN